MSTTRAPLSVDGPLLWTTTVHSNACPGTAWSVADVLATDRSPNRLTATTIDDELLVESESVIPLATPTEAPLEIEFADDVGSTVPTIVKVTEPDGARSTVVAMPPAPLAGHDDPAVPTHVHVGLRSIDARASETVVPLAADGPVL